MSKKRSTELTKMARKAVKFLRENRMLLEDTNPHIVAAYIADVEGYNKSLNKLARQIIYVWGLRE